MVRTACWFSCSTSLCHSFLNFFSKFRATEQGGRCKGKWPLDDCAGDQWAQNATCTHLPSEKIKDMWQRCYQIKRKCMVLSSNSSCGLVTLSLHQSNITNLKVFPGSLVRSCFFYYGKDAFSPSEFCACHSSLKPEIAPSLQNIVKYLKTARTTLL